MLANVQKQQIGKIHGSSQYQQESSTKVHVHVGERQTFLLAIYEKLNLVFLETKLVSPTTECTCK